MNKSATSPRSSFGNSIFGPSGQSCFQQRPSSPTSHRELAQIPRHEQPPTRTAPSSTLPPIGCATSQTITTMGEMREAAGSGHWQFRKMATTLYWSGGSRPISDVAPVSLAPNFCNHSLRIPVAFAPEIQPRTKL